MMDDIDREFSCWLQTQLGKSEAANVVCAERGAHGFLLVPLLPTLTPWASRKIVLLTTPIIQSFSLIR
jgi:hypothetical protein